MITKGIIKKGEYYDSVSLMLVSKEVTKMEGVIDVAIVMGNDQNKSILETSHLLLDEFKDAIDSDLLIAVKCETKEKVDEALIRIDEILKEKKDRSLAAGEYHPKSIDGALEFMPNANMVIISVAGKYAGDEAMKALKKGLHVMLFSDNVTLEKEKELKEYAKKEGLLVMGPDCGTAIINGVPLGFANVVNKGDIGIVAASGTGLQEVSSIISNNGCGISQGIGTGGRDVKSAIGGIMMIEGIKALNNDPETKVITLVSKPPSDDVLEKIVLFIAENVTKPTVGIFLGGNIEKFENSKIIPAETLEEAALISCAFSQGKPLDEFKISLQKRDENIEEKVKKEIEKMNDKQKYIRGLFTGGTLCDEAMLISRKIIGEVYGNSPINPDFKLKDSWKSQENSFIDLGEDEFTVGRPHPMIDYSLRNKKIIEEAKDPEVAVILLDVVLGYGSTMIPHEELAPVIREAKEIAEKDGRYLSIIITITGTEKDPQKLKEVDETLISEGAIIFKSNAYASLFASKIIEKLNKVV